MLVFWDVDTQKDFMDKDGLLYVPHAEDIKPILETLTKFALNNEIQILASMDRHFKDDVELKKFSQHCMNGTEGQKSIRETKVNNRVSIVSDKIKEFGWFTKYQYGEIVGLIKNGNKKIIFEKQYTDVFTNPHVGFCLEKLGVSTAVVYGVAIEYCVEDAVLGLLKRGITVYIVEDAIKGLKPEDEASAIARMGVEGAYVLESKDIIRFIKGGMK